MKSAIFIHVKIPGHKNFPHFVISFLHLPSFVGSNPSSNSSFKITDELKLLALLLKLLSISLLIILRVDESDKSTPNRPSLIIIYSNFIFFFRRHTHEKTNFESITQ